MTNLGFAGDAKILGKVNFARKVLVLDECLERERKLSFLFTAGHQIGHWVLHRYNWQNLNLKQYYSNNEEISDDEKMEFGLKRNCTRDWLEFQANAFAASLTMPYRTFTIALKEAQLSMGIKKNFGVVYINNDTTSKQDYENIVSIISNRLDVSKESV